MIDYQPLCQALAKTAAKKWAQQLPDQIAAALAPERHGNLPVWQKLISELPELDTLHRILDQDRVQIGLANELDKRARSVLEPALKTLMPWRKGPYDLFGIIIDSEWRSDFKWNRLIKHITPLKNRLVLDVGCGNGYFCWRMLGEQAKFVLGIDPLILNVMQFQLISKLYGSQPPVYVLPFGIEELPANLKTFDTVFSMGVLYHRRSPIDHLLDLKACLAPGGELVLETLVIDGRSGEILLPEERYAGMRNVWFIPSCDTLESWLKRCGFMNIRLADITVTTIEEQRATAWMDFKSLGDFLDPRNPNYTVEGHPAPKRAIFLANAPHNA